MVGQLANGWLTLGQWLANHWPMVGQLADGWQTGGDDFSKVGFSYLYDFPISHSEMFIFVFLLPTSQNRPTLVEHFDFQ